MRIRYLGLVIVSLGLIASACGGGGSSGGPDLVIERRTGFAVIVEDRADGVSIGFADDRDAPAGEEFDVTQSMWRVDDGPWNEPLVECLGRGQRVELGISQVENVDRPGLLKDRVVWVACLAPEDS